MKLGILRLYDRLRKMNPKTSQIEMLVTEMVDSQLDSFKKLFLNKHKVKNIIVVDDYISQIMAAKKREFISTEEYRVFLDSMRLANLSSATREIGILEENVPLFYVSAILLRCVIDTLGVEQIYVPGVTLCDGIVYEYAEKKKFITATHDFEADIIACTYNISKRYQGSMERSRTLQTICKHIFDATKKIHGMGHREELLLDIACNLHDCGKYISLSNLAECSYNIIMSTEIIGLSHLEREIVANVVRFNHEDFIYFEDQQNLSDLDRNSYLTIAKLTAILRLANGLDRSHKQKFDDIRVSVREETLLITVGEDVDITLEKGLYTERADFFEEIFGIRPVIRQRRGRR